jgi:hypothetical protein
LNLIRVMPAKGQDIVANSIFLARLIGPPLLVAGIALLLNRRAFEAIEDEILRSRALMYLSGLLIMPAGLAIVLTHNRWALGWPMLVTVLGWLMVIGGAARMLFHDQIAVLGRQFLRHPFGLYVAGGIWTALGVVLCYFGYFRQSTGAIQ